MLSSLRQPLAALVAAGLLPIIPLGHCAYRGFSSIMPEADQRVFADAEIQAMFIDDITLAARGRFQAFVDDLRLFGRDWGFRLADVRAPVLWWHGDANPIVSLNEAQGRSRACPTSRSSCVPATATSAASPISTRSSGSFARSSEPTRSSIET